MIATELKAWNGTVESEEIGLPVTESGLVLPWRFREMVPVMIRILQVTNDKLNRGDYNESKTYPGCV